MIRSLAYFAPRALSLGLFAATAGCGGGAGGGMTQQPVAVNITVSVDTGTTYQTMVGFGAASAYYSNYPSIHPSSAAIYQTLFNDLGLQVLRVGNWWDNNNDGNAAFNSTIALVQGATAALGHAPVTLMSSWNPLISLKSNGVNNAGGTLTKDASGGYDYASFGQWWSGSLAAYTAGGFTPDYVSIQNEPDFTTTNEGTCLFDPVEDATNAGYGPALDAVQAAITASGQPLPKFVGPETSGIASNRIQKYLGGLTPAQLGELSVVAHHLYNGGTSSLPNSFDDAMAGVATAAADLPTWMTEYAPSNPDLFDTAWLIQNAVTFEGVSTYLFWDLFWPAAPAGQPQSGLVSIENPTKPSTWTTTNGFFVNDPYYAVQHFAKWIAGGWQRVGATATDDGTQTADDGVQISAFISPDGSQLTLVILNTDGVDHNVTVDAGSFAFTSSNVYRSSGSAERVAAIGPLDGNNALDMPARAIATVTLAP